MERHRTKNVRARCRVGLSTDMQLGRDVGWQEGFLVIKEVTKQAHRLHSRTHIGIGSWKAQGLQGTVLADGAAGVRLVKQRLRAGAAHKLVAAGGEHCLVPLAVANCAWVGHPRGGVHTLLPDHHDHLRPPTRHSFTSDCWLSWLRGTTASLSI